MSEIDRPLGDTEVRVEPLEDMEKPIGEMSTSDGTREVREIPYPDKDPNDVIRGTLEELKKVLPVDVRTAIDINTFIRESGSEKKCLVIGLGAGGGALIGLAAGAATGALGGVVVGKFSAHGVTFATVGIGAAAGAIIGSISGAITGAVIGRFSLFCAVRKSVAFREYHNQRYQLLLKNVNSFIQEHIGVFDEFLCPISEKIIMHPVFPRGHKEIVYECEEIDKHLETHRRGRNSPCGTFHIDPRKLEYDFSYFPKLFLELIKLREEIFEGSVESCIKEVMDILNFSRKQVLGLMFEELRKLLRAKKIKENQHSEIYDYLVVEEGRCNSIKGLNSCFDIAFGNWNSSRDSLALGFTDDEIETLSDLLSDDLDDFPDLDEDGLEKGIDDFEEEESDADIKTYEREESSEARGIPNSIEMDEFSSLSKKDDEETDENEAKEDLSIFDSLKKQMYIDSRYN